MSEARVVTPKVIVRPATIDRFTAMPINSTRKRRVAAYARVSTDSDEQYTSYVAQVSYYTEYIKRNSSWDFVEVYTDEGISGTNTKKRDGFNRMIQDALDGKIDLIVTKSVSRFARNTVDSLTTIRKLKEHGVEVYFEKENINTLDSKGELLLTIMSSLAQEESRSLSENVTWGKRKQFSDGKVSMAYKHFLGYKKGENGEPEIVEEEAAIVRRIYQLFLEGKSPSGIAKILTTEGIPSPAGKSSWCSCTVRSILTNEKYKGDALLQKTFCTNFLTKKMKVNEGEVPQYYVENSHPAIIPEEIHDMVQYEMEARKNARGKHFGQYLFSGKLLCGCCGNKFGRKVWHSNDPYRRVIWRCNAKFSNQEKCATPHVTEEEVQQAFLKAANQLLSDKTGIITDCKILITILCDTHELMEEAQAQELEMQITDELLKKTIDRNAHEALNQEEYKKQYDQLDARYQKAAGRLNELNEEMRNRRAIKTKLNYYIRNLQDNDVFEEFSDALWNALVDSVTVLVNGGFNFRMKDGRILSL